MNQIGQYKNYDTLVHKFNPLIKLIFNIVLIVLIFMSTEILYQTALFVPILITYFIANKKISPIISVLKTVIFFLLFLFMINLVVIVPEAKDPWVNMNGSAKYNWTIFNLTYTSVMQTVTIAFRIFTMILTTTVLTISTKPIALTRAIEDLLFPLKIIKFPVHIIAMIISIALRFIPTLLDEAQKIMKAQASRGMDYKNGGFKTKVKSMTSLIIPLFVSAFSRAEDLGNAMEVRGYDPYEKRTRYRIYPLKMKDSIMIIFLAGMITFSVLTKQNIIHLTSWQI